MPCEAGIEISGRGRRAQRINAKGHPEVAGDVPSMLSFDPCPIRPCSSRSSHLSYQARQTWRKNGGDGVYGPSFTSSRNLGCVGSVFGCQSQGREELYVGRLSFRARHDSDSDGSSEESISGRLKAGD